jgi:hydroxymethylpyrimidine/phosphomethylpyrimidine kinase
MGLARQFGAMVLVKGGHTQTADVTDILYGPDGETARWSAPRIDTTSTHGTGCTLASAIATGLGQGMTLPDAIARAIRFVRRALEAAPGFGKGHGPMGQQSVTDVR